MRGASVSRVCPPCAADEACPLGSARLLTQPRTMRDTRQVHAAGGARADKGGHERPPPFVYVTECVAVDLVPNWPMGWQSRHGCKVSCGTWRPPLGKVRHVETAPR